MDAALLNRQLDTKLATDCVVSRELYLRLAEAHGYGTASTIGWVEARLRVLAKRVESSAPLTLYTPQGTQLMLCQSLVELQAWASESFPDARLEGT
ncbi:hypothetical protein FHT07_000246 [Xanthomonas arboricola]|nr:hypothetical protein [Xanthomonas arboricola]